MGGELWAVNYGWWSKGVGLWVLDYGDSWWRTRIQLLNYALHKTDGSSL